MKWRRLIFHAIPALVVMLCPGYAGASGFQLFEQNASGIGNAYAGTAAVAENASTIFFNPAGMTQLQDREISLGLSAVRPSFKFNNNGSTTPTAFTAGATVPATGNDGGDAGGWGYIPNAYISWAFTKDLYAGIGLTVPFGLATEYDSLWYGSYQAVKFAIKTYDVNPSLAYRVSDRISLGFGISWQKFEAEYIRHATPLLGPPTGQVKLEADDSSLGWNVGAMFQLSPTTRLGLAYRSPVSHTLEGDLTGVGGTVNVQATADVKLPDTATLSILQGLSDRWELLGDISWTGWSSIDKLSIVNRATGAPLQTLDADFRDTWRVALGSNYKLDNAWKLKLGLTYDQTPVPDAEHRLVSLPDNDRIAFAVGTQFRPAKSSALDIGIEYLYLRSTDINNDQNPTRGIVRGSYNSNALMLGAQYSIGF